MEKIIVMLKSLRMLLSFIQTFLESLQSLLFSQRLCMKDFRNRKNNLCLRRLLYKQFYLQFLYIIYIPYLRGMSPLHLIIDVIEKGVWSLCFHIQD